ncbi:MAG TPA: YqaJ viral recombinase family protein, partial [Fervidobacterium sp.]|nr:YqaJ viral recombinase family protein [Fervidobacterium sp.]
MHKFEKNTVIIDPPKRPKKITGTRFASILDLDRWNTPFKTWCAITRTYEEPFVDNKYTIAGKIIEPKVIDYLNKVYFFGGLKSPTDIYGKDYFKKTWGDFFPNVSIFGGMWDGLLYDEKGNIVAVIEIKTTKRAEDWSNGAPNYYALQAALYAYLLGIDNVVMIASFLEEEDYEHPEKFVPSSDNTIIDEFKISERFPQFQAHIDRAVDWWNAHVVTGISPAFDEKKDEEILKELRKNTIETDSDIAALIAEGEALKNEIDAVIGTISEKEKRLKVVTDLIKQHCLSQFREGDEKVTVAGAKYEWIVSRTESTEIDKDALKKDGLLEKYSKPKVGYRITQ